MARIKAILVIMIVLAAQKGSGRHIDTAAGSQLRGRVYDHVYEPLGNARLLLFQAGEPVDSCLTDSIGQYVFDSLRADSTYTLFVDSRGFIPVILRKIWVTSPHNTYQNFTMKRCLDDCCATIVRDYVIPIRRRSDGSGYIDYVIPKMPVRKK
jgi:hypothetical protein